MYEDLIQVLRHCGNENVPCDGCSEYEYCDNFNTGAAKNMREAANAIEELNKQHEKWEEALKTTLNFVPCWIPVTEMLPESGVHVLALCRVKYAECGGRSYVCNAFYSKHFKEQRNTEYDDIELDYDEETDEYYLPEGWWEVIMNWDEYGFVGIADFVTHWMPLPEPPKEEA